MADLGRVAIVGAGPTGLGAALRLKEAGHANFKVYEAAPIVGGLASSRVDARGFTWDIGCHVQFSHYAYFDALMDRALGPDGWLQHERDSWVWIRGRFVPYPFQYNIRHLPTQEIRECLDGIHRERAFPRAGPPSNFAEWIVDRFGGGICDAFMRPYNLKVWAYPLERLAYDWMGDRVAIVDLPRLEDNIRLGRDDRDWGPNRTFRFPRRGGTGAIWNAVAGLVGMENIRLSAPVVEVVADKKTLRLADGRVESYDRLLNTGPLDEFAQTVVGLPLEIKKLAKSLLYSSTHVVGVGLRGQPGGNLAKKGWIYFPEPDVPFHRATVFSNYSPHNVPDSSRFWSLMTETSESPEKPVDATTLVEKTIEGLLDAGLIRSREDVVSTWRHKAKHGYPTPFVGRDGILAVLQKELAKLGLASRGRFGAWKYEVSNQDHSLMQGVEWAENFLTGAPEATWTRPSTVNAR